MNQDKVIIFLSILAFGLLILLGFLMIENSIGLNNLFGKQPDTSWLEIVSESKDKKLVVVNRKAIADLVGNSGFFDYGNYWNNWKPYMDEAGVSLSTMPRKIKIILTDKTQGYVKEGAGYSFPKNTYAASFESGYLTFKFQVSSVSLEANNFISGEFATNFSKVTPGDTNTLDEIRKNYSGTKVLFRVRSGKIFGL